MVIEYPTWMTAKEREECNIICSNNDYTIEMHIKAKDKETLLLALKMASEQLSNQRRINGG